MIEKIILDNFKSHAHTEIELGRVTALVGPNGCGKTSVLQAVYVLNQLLKQMVGEAGNWHTIHQYARKGHQPKEMKISVVGAGNAWGVIASGALLTDNHQQHGKEQELFQSFGQVVYFKANAQSIAAPSYKLDIPPVIGIDGDGLASVISYLKTSQEETHERIEKELKTIVPLVKRVRVRPINKTVKEKRTISANGNTLTYDEDRQVIAQELIFDTVSGDALPASMISEGTLVTFALLTLLHTTNASLFLLDDIEQGLHPLAQIRLMQMLKAFAEQHNRQIILTSHSPYILDALEVKDVWVMDTDKEGISRCARLSDHPDIKTALGALTTGETWSASGEDWVLKTEELEEAHA